MSSVNSLSISGFQSIRELEGFRLGSLNVLIGANGAGKSNLLGFFRLASEMVNQRLQRFTQLQGGPDALLHFGRKTTGRLRGEFHFDFGSYEFDLLPNRDNRLIFDREVSRSKVLSPDGTPCRVLGNDHAESRLGDAGDRYSARVRDTMGAWRLYHFFDSGETAKVSQVHPVNDTLRLRMEGENLAPYLRMLRREHAAAYRKIVRTIRQVAPFFRDFLHRPGEPEHVELEWTHEEQPDMPFKAYALSDGTLRFMRLATLLLQPVELLPDTILIDEPELGLHPYALSVLAAILRQVSERRQLIVSTQSVELVNELEPEDVIVVDREDGASGFRRPDPEELEDWLEEYALGELWNRNILDGRP